MPERRILSLLILANCAVACALSACGDYPPVIDSAADVRRVSLDERFIWARGLRDADIPELARLVNLEGFDTTAGCAVQEAELTDEGLRTLSGLGLPRLTHVLLGWNDKITDAGLAHVCKLSPLLYLDLRGNPNISDEGLKQLARECNIEGLNLRGCEQITDDGITHLAEMEGLLEITLGGCPRVSDEGVKAFQEAMPNARVTKDETMWALDSDGQNP